MIVVPIKNHFLAITYTSEQPGEATVCLYEDHGHGIVELTPVLYGDGVLTVPVDDADKDKVELLMELKRILPLAESRFRILNMADNARLLRPEDFQEGNE